MMEVLDEHNEAFYLIEENIARGVLRKGSFLMHVDSHSDINLPVLKDSLYSVDHAKSLQGRLRILRRLTESQINMGSFITPLILRGSISKIFFVHSPWFSPNSFREVSLKCTENTTNHGSFFIGSLAGEGKVLLEFNGQEKMPPKLFDDLKECEYFSFQANSIEKIKEKIKAGEIILGIDLDYFSCNKDPLVGYQIKISKAEKERIGRFFVSQDKYKFNLNNFFNIQKLDEGYSIDLMPKKHPYIYNNSEQMIYSAIYGFVKGINSIKLNPKKSFLVRSVKSGHTPKKYASFIENTLIHFLEDGLPSKNTFHYPDDETFLLDDSVYFIKKEKSECLVVHIGTNKRFVFKGISFKLLSAVAAGANFSRLVELTRRENKISDAVARDHTTNFLNNLKNKFILL